METESLKQDLMKLNLDELENIIIRLGKDNLVLKEKIINLINEGEDK